MSDTNSKTTVESADGAKIGYLVRGNGEAAPVFAHCWLCNQSSWDRQDDVRAANKWEAL